MKSDQDPQFDSLLPAARLSRRGFVTTLAAAGFALAVQPVQAQSVIRTDAEGLDTGEARIAVDGGELPVYFARPAGRDKMPVILVVQEIFGVHEYIRDVCRRLAREGYLAIAPELFFRQGDPTAIDNVAEILQAIVAKVPDAQVMADLDACAAWAADKGGDATRLGITGFCWGGRITWLYAAHNPALKAGVAWY
ncbi:MAG: dienelactone hydrolase family protein, partial [Thauera phenolivorans]|nr:dienelactone hydrolase family protein [Thauera phenolivorans]